MPVNIYCIRIVFIFLCTTYIESFTRIFWKTAISRVIWIAEQKLRTTRSGFAVFTKNARPMRMLEYRCQENCLHARKPSLLEEMTFIDLYYISTKGLVIFGCIQIETE